MGLFGPGWLLLWSSIRVFLFLVSIHFYSQSVMQVNFLNQNPCMPSQTGVFLFGIFLRVALSESICIFSLGLSSTLGNSFSLLFNHSTFLLWYRRSHTLLQNYFVSFASGFWNVFSLHSPTWKKNFIRCFERSCFICIVWSCFGIFLVFLLSPQLSLWISFSFVHC